LSHHPKHVLAKSSPNLFLDASVCFCHPLDFVVKDSLQISMQDIKCPSRLITGIAGTRQNVRMSCFVGFCCRLLTD